MIKPLKLRSSGGSSNSCSPKWLTLHCHTWAQPPLIKLQRTNALYHSSVLVRVRLPNLNTFQRFHLVIEHLNIFQTPRVRDGEIWDFFKKSSKKQLSRYKYRVYALILDIACCLQYIQEAICLLLADYAERNKFNSLIRLKKEGQCSSLYCQSNNCWDAVHETREIQ